MRQALPPPGSPLRRTRRALLHHALRGGAAALLAPALGAALAGCQRAEPLLRVGSNVWPGYEFLHLAQAEGRLDGQPLRMIEMASATEVLQALAAGRLEGGALTLDELIGARAAGLDLVAVLVCDESAGGDALVARPGLKALGELAGRCIGVEQSAVGALMLDGALRSAGLEPGQVDVLVLGAGEQLQAWHDGRVDALVCFQPVLGQVLREGGELLFDSRAMPGAIVDLLVVRREALEPARHALQTLLKAHFALLAQWRAEPQRLAEPLARRLGVAAEAVAPAFDGLQLVDVAANRLWLGGAQPRLNDAATRLVEVMLHAGLLRQRPPLAQFASAQALPDEAPA